MRFSQRRRSGGCFRNEALKQPYAAYDLNNGILLPLQYSAFRLTAVKKSHGLIYQWKSQFNDKVV